MLAVAPFLTNFMASAEFEAWARREEEEEDARQERLTRIMDGLTYEAALDIVISFVENYLGEHYSERDEAALWRVQEGRGHADT